ncbi:hypothetical protein ANCCAN_03622, partial [Ancylostoma caninum]
LFIKNQIRSRNRKVLRGEILCTHPVTGKIISLDKVDSKDLLCEYSQVCAPDCVCCQFGNCDCKAVCPTGCACFRDALFETNVVRCENLTHMDMKVGIVKMFQRCLTPNLLILVTGSITLHNNDLTNVSPALASSGVRSMSLSGNAFRCNCTPRFLAPMWIHENRAKVVDMNRVRCVENVTESFRNNDTTVLSAYPPNVGHNIFTMPMDEFLRDFNRTIYVPAASGFFGQELQNSILTIIFLTSCAFLLCAVTLLGVSLVRKAHNDMSQRRLHAIPDELISEMGASKCLVTVLTKNFLESEWKMLQAKGHTTAKFKDETATISTANRIAMVAESAK